MAAEGASMGPSEMFWQLRHLLLFASVSSLASTLMLPAADYAGLNYFASKHTAVPWRQVHCESDVTPAHCQAGLRDQSRATNVIMLVTPFVQVFVAPALGAYADVVGRRPGLLIAQVCTLLLALAGTSGACLGTSWWLALAFFPLAQDGVMVGLMMNTICLDLVPAREMRAVGLGLLTAVSSASAIVGLAVSSLLTLSQAMLLGMSLLCAQTFYIYFMPETLNASLCKSGANRSIVPDISLNVLWRTPMLRRVTLLLVVAGFADAGCDRVAGYVLQGRMNWTVRNTQAMLLSQVVSIVMWTGITFRPLLMLLGEAHVLILGRLAVLVDNVITFSASRPWQVLASRLAFSGPTQFTSPVIGALKSQLVSEHEQARVQAALNVGLAVSNTLGSLFTSCIYQNLNSRYAGGSPPYQAVFLPLAVALSGLVLALSCLLPGQLSRFGPGPAEGDARGQAAAILPGPGGGQAVLKTEDCRLSGNRPSYGTTVEKTV